MSKYTEPNQPHDDRLAVFAGVFDPVHRGHIAAAEAVAKTYGTTVIFIPEKVPLHKQKTEAYNHRLSMLRIATEHLVNIHVTEVPDTSHFIRSLFGYLAKIYAGKHFIWMVGGDVVSMIAKWPDATMLRELGVEKIVVVSRATDRHDHISEINGTPVEYIDDLPDIYKNLSSTQIRNDIEGGQKELPDGVMAYVQSHSLYGL